MSEEIEVSKPRSRTYDPFKSLMPTIPSVWMGPAWLGNLAHLGSEVASFIAERIQNDMRTQHALMHCKTMAEVQHVQAQFLQKAFDQYHAETGKLVEMTNRMTAQFQGEEEAGRRN